MVRYGHCVIRHCPFNKNKENRGDGPEKCHKFPKDIDVCNKWAKFVERAHVVGGPYIPKKKSLLCSAHFKSDCYVNSRLKKDAVPTIIPELTPEVAVKLGIAPSIAAFNAMSINMKPAEAGSQSEAASNAACVSPVSDAVAAAGFAHDHCYILQEHNSRAAEEHVADLETCAGPACDTDQNDAVAADAGIVKKGPPRRSLLAKFRTSVPISSDIPVKRRKTDYSGEPFPLALEECVDDPSEGVDDLREAPMCDRVEVRTKETASTEDTETGDPDCTAGSNVDCTPRRAAGDKTTSVRETPLSITSTPNTSSGSSCRSKRIAFVGDMSPSDFRTPRRARRHLERIKDLMSSRRHDNRILKQRLRRARKKITDLRSLLDHLKEEDKVSHEMATLVEARFSGENGALLKSVLQGKKGRKYDALIRQFALTLNFHSPAAYRYVRTTLLRDALPHPRTLSKWYGCLDGKPGFTEEARKAIETQAAMLRRKGKTLCLALVCDEMCIRKSLHYSSDGTVSGFVDDGSGAASDASPLATQAWVFMAVAINGSWKLPVGYFFIDAMSANKRSNILSNCLTFLNGTGARCVSLTLDGTTTNIATVENLGAGMQPNHNWHPHFPHPVTNEPVYVFLDAAHMAKLWRNVLGNNQTCLQDLQGRDISFGYIAKLHELQAREGLRAANKLTRRHIRFEKEKMKVSLATQTLSTSVADALDMCRDEWHLPEFRGCEGTVQFIRMADMTFDILNSSNLGGNSFMKRALSPTNIEQVRDAMEKSRQYIRGLKVRGRTEPLACSTSILESRWKTGFVGFLCDMENLAKLYTELVESGNLVFLPAYKFSQDHLEMFFGAVRSKGGWNNNPSTTQFQAAYKRLLVHTELKENKAGMNCFPVELVSILHVTPKRPEAAEEDLEDTELISTFGHNSMQETECVLNRFVSDVVEYIAGFVVRKVSSRHGCGECTMALISPAEDNNLIRRKNRGGLYSPSDDVILMCRKAESLLRAYADRKTFLTTKLDAHVIRIYREIVSCYPNLLSSLEEHVAEQAPLNNHKWTLIRLIIKKYLIVRMCWDVKKINNTVIENRIRSRCTKTVLFQNQ